MRRYRPVNPWPATPFLTALLPSRTQMELMLEQGQVWGETCRVRVHLAPRLHAGRLTPDLPASFPDT